MSIYLTQLGSDNFQYANVNPLPSPPWTVANTHGLQVVSDVCQGTFAGSNCDEIYSNISPSADQYASVTLSNVGTHDSFFSLFVRSQSSSSVSNCYQLLVRAVASFWALYSVVSGSQTQLAAGSPTVSDGDVWTLAVIGSTLYVLQNGTQLGSVSNSTYSSGSYVGLEAIPETVVTDMQFSLFALGNASLSLTQSISGNAGVASATVSYSGQATGSVTADGSGNFSIGGLANGSYTITPSLAGYTFSPTSRNETVSGANITGVNFTATAGSAYYSQPDCRVAVPGFGPGPNSAVNVNGTLTYTQQTSANSEIPPADSRVNKPVQSSTVSQNNRNPSRYT